MFHNRSSTHLQHLGRGTVAPMDLQAKFDSWLWGGGPISPRTLPDSPVPDPKWLIWLRQQEDGRPLGGALVTIAAASLITTLLQSHPTWHWWYVIGLAVFGLLGGLLVTICRRPENPIIQVLQDQLDHLKEELQTVHDELREEQASHRRTQETLNFEIRSRESQRPEAGRPYGGGDSPTHLARPPVTDQDG
jgi:hypothetical protein